MTYHFNNRIEIYKEVSAGPYPGMSGKEVIARP
ncbi:Uncharacterised protein [Staphylococcus nepalensis]|nr:Uncharacterised protein [Staphylococcus nepalensis]SUM95281.1 Uncharacterised protein [Staphylococcus nepalensis]